MTSRVEQLIDGSHGYSRRSTPHKLYAISRADGALLQDANIEAGPAMLDKERRHLGAAGADAEPVTGDPRLRDFHECLAHPEAVSDTDLAVR